MCCFTKIAVLCEVVALIVFVTMGRGSKVKKLRIVALKGMRDDRVIGL